MADSSLDDFFAKKDKRTKKSKNKLTPTEILVKQEEQSKAEKKKKKEKDKSQNPPSSTGPTTSKTVREEDQEWHEYEDEKEKDYSGLRIQNLQISKEDEDEGSDRRDSDDEGEEGEEGKERREGTHGPWNKSTGSQPPSEAKPPAPEPAAKVEEPKTAGKYIPPSVRYAASAGSSAHASRRKKGAPNLRSEEDFPTLGGGVGGSGGPRWGDQDLGERNFEQVRGGRQQEDSASKPVSLTLGNKFQALKQE